MPKFKDLEYDIKALLTGSLATEHLTLEHATAEHIVTLAKNIATHTLDMVNHKPPKAKATNDFSIRMSELGEPCHRKLLYKWYSPELGLPPYAENPEPFLPVKFTYGDYVEELTLFLAKEAGHTVKGRQREVTVGSPGTEWNAVGHIDAEIDEYVVDVKSAADVSFKKYQREGLTEENDTFGYLWQLDAYATALLNTNRAIIFANKHDGHLKIIDRAKEPLLPVRDMILTIGAEATNYLTMSGMPERMPTKVTKYGHQLGTACSYCAFKWKCYDGDISGIISSGKPMYFVKSTLTKEGHDLVKEKTTITCPEGAVPF